MDIIKPNKDQKYPYLVNGHGKAPRQILANTFQNDIFNIDMAGEFNDDLSIENIDDYTDI